MHPSHPCILLAANGAVQRQEGSRTGSKIRYIFWQKIVDFPREGRQTHLSQFILQPCVTLSKDNCTNRPYMQAHALLWCTALYCDIVAIFSSKCVILLWVCSLTLCLLSTVAGNCLQGHTVHLWYYLLRLSPLANSRGLFNSILIALALLKQPWISYSPSPVPFSCSDDLTNKIGHNSSKKIKILEPEYIFCFYLFHTTIHFSTEEKGSKKYPGLSFWSDWAEWAFRHEGSA